jgi:magnesium-protoporphyrin IX monomethyl ester (oxidative) cyclase
MLNIALVNTPFAYVNAPSLALIQLRGVLNTGQHRDHVAVSEHYVNIDFAKRFGLSLYNYAANSPDILCCGLGDWIFRRAAFPDAPDNVDEYFDRYRDRFPAGIVDGYWGHVLSVRSTVEQLIEGILDERAFDTADIVGFSSMFAQNVAAIAFARAVKRRNPNALIVIGGANCESPMGQRLAGQVDCIDYVFSGPALVSFSEFVGCVRRGDLDACDRLPGVFPTVGRRARARIATPAVSKGPRLLTVVDQKPVIGPDREIDEPIPLDYEPFLTQLAARFTRTQVTPTLYFETSRGCWWGEKAHCTFCGLNGSTMHYRSMSPARAIVQFEQLFKYAPDVTELFSVDNILPREYYTSVLPHLDTPPTMRIFYELKVGLSEQDFEALAKARVLKIQPGIESLATSTLRLMKKGTTAQQNIDFLKNCSRYGIFPTWNILVGFPGEPEDVYRNYVEVVPSLVHLPPPTGVFPIRFDRFSPYERRADEYGLKLRPMEFYELVYPFPADDLKDLAYFFVDARENATYAEAVNRWIDRMRQPVREWRSRWDSGGAGERPVLRFTEETRSRIVDTRFAEPMTYEVDPVSRAILDLLAKPCQANDVGPRLAGALSPGANVDAALADIMRRRLVFVEGDRLMSLVEPPPLANRDALSTRPNYGTTAALLTKWA